MDKTNGENDKSKIVKEYKPDNEVKNKTTAKVKDEIKEKSNNKEGYVFSKIKKLSRIKRIKLRTHFAILISVAVAYLGFATYYLHSSKVKDDYNWENWQVWNDEETINKIEEKSEDSTAVKVGTYFENIRDVNIKSSQFRVEMAVWYMWQGNSDLDIANHIRVYKGTINNYVITDEFHDGEINYQKARMDVTVNTNFDTVRFPFGTYTLKIYIEPDYGVNKVCFYDDEMSDINENADIAGYEVMRYDTGIFNVKYHTNYGNPNNGEYYDYSKEHLTRVEIRQNGMGTYTKCFIALIGALVWIFILMYINIYHRIDPMFMVPAAFFAAVTNISVGAAMLPDSLSLGLLEFVNIWGEFTIIAAAVIVINVNYFRNRWKDINFAHAYGKVMFYTLLTITVLGHIIMPLATYKFV
jgi:hypothetical protein